MKSIHEANQVNSTHMQRTVPERKPGTSSLEPKQIEQMLLQALDAGVNALADQVKYVLGSSQILAQTGLLNPAALEPYSPKFMTAVQARLWAEVQFVCNVKSSEKLPNPEKVSNLLQGVKQIADTGIRLALQAQLLRYLPESEQHSHLRDMWQQLALIEDPLMSSRVLLTLVGLPVLNQTGAKISKKPMPEIVEMMSKITGVEARVRSLSALVAYMPPEIAAVLIDQILDDIDTSQNDVLRANTIVTIAPQINVEQRMRILAVAEKIKAPGERARAFAILAQTFPQRGELRLRAIEAIAAIANEEERSEALISFASSLEEATIESGYSEALQEALSVVVSIARRPTRARALVALAPHLTLDLKGEALAAVHSLPNERDRATLLSILAPNLPPSMLVASLAVAHTMQEQDARVHALSVLAHYVPDHAQGRTMLDALAAASNLANPYERVLALVRLFDILPESLQEQAYTNAVETTRLIENENTRARALSLLSQHLPPHLLARALDLGYQIRDLQQCLNTLVSFVDRLDVAKRREALLRMLDCAREMPFEYRRARAIVTIAPHLTVETLPEALTITEALHDPYDKASVYIAFAQNLPRNQRPQYIVKTWTLLRQIEDGYDRASALVAIAPFLPETAQSDVLTMVYDLIKAIPDEYDKASAITLLAPLLHVIKPVEPSPTPLPSRFEIIQRAVLNALEAKHQMLRTQLLADTISVWLSCSAVERYNLWKQAAIRLKALPLADVLLCLSVLVQVFQMIGSDEQLERILQLLSAGGAREKSSSKQVKTGGIKA